MNNYHIYEEIAQGKHSTIHKARQRKTIDYYAIKSLDLCRRKKLMNEVKIFQSLEHVNILQLYNWYESQNHLWAVFEYASGGNLISLIKQDKKLTESQVKTFAKDLIQGLHYLHSKGVIYCDLKPQNILLNEYGTLKYCDLGLARLIINLIQTPEEVLEGSKKANCYMAPELFEEDGVYSMQSDLWSLGCVLYEMGTGKPPFRSQNFNELISQILNKDFETIPGFSNEFHSFISGLLNRHPLKRFAWKEIISHPFLNWNPLQLKNLQKVKIPSQPHFEMWSSNKYPNINNNRAYQNAIITTSNYNSNQIINVGNQNSSLTSIQNNQINRQQGGVNVLRLSLNAIKSLQKDQKNTYSSVSQKNKDDSPLSNNNGDKDYLEENKYNKNEQKSPRMNLIQNQNPNAINYYNSNGNMNSSNSQNNIININNYLGSQNVNPINNIIQNVSLKVNSNSNPNINIVGSCTTPSNVVSISLLNGGINTPTQIPIQKVLVSSQTQQKYQISNRSRLTQQQQQLKLQEDKNGISSKSPCSPNELSGPKTPNSIGGRHLSSGANTVSLITGITATNMKNPSTPNGTAKNTTTKSVSPIHSHVKTFNLQGGMKKPSNLYCLPQTGKQNTEQFQSQKAQQQSQQNHSRSQGGCSNASISPNRKNSPANLSQRQAEIKTPEEKQQSSNLTQILNPPLNQSGLIVDSVEKLLFHNTDIQVKPIIGHKDMEKHKKDIEFVRETLPFTVYSAEDVERDIENPEIQRMFDQIFSALQSGRGEKQNILCYFENIIQHQNVANLLINSAFMNLLLSLLQTVKQSSIKLRVASSIGFLLRYATVIENELSKLNLSSIIIEALSSESDVQVRRKLMATLGEYLFYAATQVDEDPNQSVWRINATTLQFVVRTLRNTEEDEMVRFFACKTVENISCQSLSVGIQLCTSENVSALSNVYLTSRNDELKISSIVTLTQLARLKNALGDSVIASLGGIGKIREILKGDNATYRVQQAILTLVNIQMSTLPGSDLSHQLFLLHSDTILGLLESPHTIVRGKAILTIALIIQHYTKSLIDLAHTKFFVLLDKLTRDNFKYVQQTHQYLKFQIIRIVPLLFQLIKDDILTLSQHKFLHYPYSSNQNNSHLPSLQGNLQYLHVLVQVASCPLVRNVIYEQSCLEQCFYLLELLQREEETSLREAKSVLINLYEVLISNGVAIQERKQYFLVIMIPHLMEELQRSTKETCKLSDINRYIRFTCVKLIHDLMTVLLPEWKKWGSLLVERTQDLFVNVFLTQSVLGKLLESENNKSPEEDNLDSVGLMSLRVLHILVEEHPSVYVSALRQKQLVGVILRHFNPSASRSTLKLVALIVQASSIFEVTQYSIAQKSVNLFQHFRTGDQDACCEDMFDIFLALIEKLSSPSISFNKPIALETSFDPNYDVLLVAYSLAFPLLSSLDYSLGEKVATFILYILHVFGKRFSLSSLSISDNSQVILSLIAQYHMVPTILKRNIRILQWIVHLVPLPLEIRQSIIQTLQSPILHISDVKINSLIQEIILKTQQK